MPVVKNLLLRAGADFGPMQKAMKKAAKDTAKFRQNFANTAKNIARVALVVGSAVAYAAHKSIQAYEEEAISEVKLMTVMKQRMGATNDMVKSIIDLTSAQQRMGVIEDGAQKNGAQMLATFLHQQSSLEALIPAMNDLAAQQYGVSATGEDLVNIGKMMGKVFTGQTGALKKAGISFTKAQEAVLKYGNEQEKAAMLAQVITDNVGNMNKALANTPMGRIAKLKNSFGDLQENIGKALQPLRDAFVPVLQNLINYFDGLLVRMKPAIQYAQIFLETLFNVKAAKLTEEGKKAIEGATKAEKDRLAATKKTAKALFGFDEINQLQKDTTESIDDNVESTNNYTSAELDLADSIVLTKEKIQEAINKANEFKKTFENIVRTIKTIGPLLIGLIGTIALVKAGAAAISFYNAISGIATAALGVKGLQTVVFSLGGTALTTGAAFAAWAGIIGAALAVVLLLISNINKARTAIEGLQNQVDSNVQQANVTIPNALAKMTPEQRQSFAEKFAVSSKTSVISADYGFFSTWLAGWKDIFGIQGKADGGFVDRGQMFVARESGPELVGSMGGKTAVANNDQIIEGVARGVARGMAAAGGGGAGNISVYIGNEQLDNYMVRQSERRSIRTNGR